MDLSAALRQYWGYTTFRPKQEAVVRSILAGRDVAVVMPTGGGKSLCYQLPAVVDGGTAVVISPLISLMQDQAAQLTQQGIPAAIFNSSIAWMDQRTQAHQARGGAFRLIYLSPERIVSEQTLEWLQGVPVSYFVIDEAHCISEWGHEFRPEYRNLRILRERFPDRPLAAFTASATQRVRHDIIHQLALRDPDKYILSFHRPNLRYLVRKCESGEQEGLLLRALEAHENESQIVYVPTVASVGATVDLLAEQGVEAVAYHGQMSAEERRRAQEQWMADEARVLVGTIAFGLGINKPSVRAVIHLSLPKSLEQYYQEAGRAGRDGEPADCVLLWQGKDAGLLAYFIQQIEDRTEQQRAWDRYRTIRGFAEAEDCRHARVCQHFGERPKWERCGHCDICCGQPSWLKAEAARGRRPAAPRVRTRAVLPVGDSVDQALGDYLREWRRKLSRDLNIPVYVVMHDATLEELVRVKPVSLAALLQITGFGIKKAERYGAAVLNAIAQYQKGARAEIRKVSLASPREATRDLLRQGKTLEEIAVERDRSLDAVSDLVARMVAEGELEFNPAWIRPGHVAPIEAALERFGSERLKPVKDTLPSAVTYVEIRLVAAAWERRKRASQAGTATQP